MVCVCVCVGGGMVVRGACVYMVRGGSGAVVLLGGRRFAL